jgi:dienelactone hydrolase
MPFTDSLPPSRQYLSWVQQRALAMREADSAFRSRAEWETHRRQLRNRLLRSWGGFPDTPCPLEPRKMGELTREGYRVEKLLIQTLPGVQMTANAYVPHEGGPFPAVLCVHGHWPGAKQDPTVQARCIGLVKLGFFVLCVDAFGAGERGLATKLGEYHGEMVAAPLWPAGIPLSGIQVYENMRAVDYLQSRSEVHRDQIGVTGASGGGNQSMYVGAYDERLKCVVPVCSVGTYQAYLGAACCLCEVVPGAISYTEEWGVLGLVAPRGLMVINATRDAFQFSVDEARKSTTAAEKIYRLYDAPQQIRHTTFESPHDYNQAMREAMYGWMTRHLKGEGTGEPIPEPPFEVEDPEVLRCYPEGARPDTFMTLPQFAARTARAILARRPIPDHVEHWRSEQSLMRDGLESILGGAPDPLVIPSPAEDGRRTEQRRWEFSPEPGIRLPVLEVHSDAPVPGIALLLDLDRGRDVLETPLAATLREAGWSLLGVDLRATASLAHDGDRIQRAPDHNTAQWGVWLGLPLLGQWVRDLRRLLDHTEAQHQVTRPRLAVVGVGTAGLVALSLAAWDERIERTATIGSLASYISDVPYDQQRLGVMVPDILRQVGDVGHIASLIAPRRLIVAGGVQGDGTVMPAEPLGKAFAPARMAYGLEGSPREFQLLPEADAGALVKAMGHVR